LFGFNDHRKLKFKCHKAIRSPYHRRLLLKPPARKW
jgi:hypothetical protein